MFQSETGMITDVRVALALPHHAVYQDALFSNITSVIWKMSIYVMYSLQALIFFFIFQQKEQSSLNFSSYCLKI